MHPSSCFWTKTHTYGHQQVIPSAIAQRPGNAYSSWVGVFPSLLPGCGTLCSWLQGMKDLLPLLSSLLELCVLTSQHVATGLTDTLCAHSGASPKVRSCRASRRMASTASAPLSHGSGSRPSCLPRCVLISSIPSALGSLHGSICCKSPPIKGAYGREHAVHRIA